MVAPLVVAALTPFVKDLFANGLSILGDAVMKKGKDVVEEKLGVSLDGKSTSELRTIQFEHEEKLLSLSLEKAKLDIEAEKVAQGAVTERWKADMLSDSWLSKNIRPMVLLFLLSAYSLFSIASAFQVFVTQAYVELLGNMLMLVISAYFIGRSTEKIVDMKERGK